MRVCLILRTFKKKDQLVGNKVSSPIFSTHSTLSSTPSLLDLSIFLGDNPCVST